MITGSVKRDARGRLHRIADHPFQMPITGSAGRAVPLLAPADPEGVVFKYVDRDHADSLAQGIFKIGTLASFGVIEGRRTDAAEGQHVVESGDNIISGVGGVDDSVEAMRHFGFEVMPGAIISNVRLKNCRSYSQCADLHALCFQGNHDHPDDLERPQAVFAVHDVEELAWRLTAACSQLHNFILGKVRYAERRSNPFEGPVGAGDPFIKPPSAFRWENETRICWGRRDWNRPVAPILVQVKAAKLLERIR